MPAREPNWALYRTFLEVLRGGSLSAAARALGLTQPTVGRHIDALEAHLQCALFVRTQRGFSPTEAAKRLAPHAEALEASASALLRSMAEAGDAVTGTVRLTASEIIAVEVLPPILAALSARHPGLVIELVPSNRVEDLLQREADIAVRMTRPTQAQLVARRLGDIRLGLYAHRDYLARRGQPAGIEALAHHALIGFDHETEFTREVGKAWPWLARQHFTLRTDSDVAGLAVLRAGFGIGVCQHGLARRDPNLAAVLPEVFDHAMGVWLVVHENLRRSPACRAVFDALAEGLTRYIAG